MIRASSTMQLPPPKARCRFRSIPSHTFFQYNNYYYTSDYITLALLFHQCWGSKSRSHGLPYPCTHARTHPAAGLTLSPWVQSEKSTAPLRPPNRGKTVSPPSSTSLRYLVFNTNFVRGFPFFAAVAEGGEGKGYASCWQSLVRK